MPLRYIIWLVFFSFPRISSELRERIKRPTVCLGAEKMNAGSTASCSTTGGKIRYDWKFEWSRKRKRCNFNYYTRLLSWKQQRVNTCHFSELPKPLRRGRLVRLQFGREQLLSLVTVIMLRSSRIFSSFSLLKAFGWTNACTALRGSSLCVVENCYPYNPPTMPK